MSRIEELPDDFGENLNIDDQPTNAASLDDLLSQHISQNGGKEPQEEKKSFEQTMREFSKTPLFMDGLDVAGDAGMSPA
jgi:hypothetical protein